MWVNRYAMCVICNRDTVGMSPYTYCVCMRWDVNHVCMTRYCRAMIMRGDIMSMERRYLCFMPVPGVRIAATSDGSRVSTLYLPWGVRRSCRAVCASLRCGSSAL